MNASRLSISLLVAVGLGLVGAAEAPPPAAMTTPAQARLSVQTARLVASTYAPSVAGYARVIDAVPLATLESDLSAALATAAASQAEASRARTLNGEDQMVATKVAEAAVATARADQAKVRLFRQRLGLEWGPGIAALSDSQRAGLVQALATGNAVLLRIDAATPSAGLGSVTLDLGPLGTAQARILGPARTADPRLQSSGRLALVTGPRAQSLGVGLVLPVHLPAGASSSGVIAPDSAVLRAEGSSWVYIRTGAETFARRQLVQPAPVEGGLFVVSGLTAGDVVAIHGASALYAAEQAADPAAASVGD
ncbi:hypothetical protein BH10PSE2_BH10PSE2_04310 [soil metagenome]